MWFVIFVNMLGSARSIVCVRVGSLSRMWMFGGWMWACPLFVVMVQWVPVFVVMVMLVVFPFPSMCALCPSSVRQAVMACSRLLW